MIRGKILAGCAAFAMIVAGVIGSSPSAAVESTPDVVYAAHVASIGWMAEVEDGATAGTTGRALRMEALRLADAGYLPPLRVQAHVSNIGWQAAKTTPATVGTTGRALQMEALKISMPNAPAGVHVEYRAHVATIGWQPWVRDGATAGTTGKGLRMEAVQIRIVQPTAAQR